MTKPLDPTKNKGSLTFLPCLVCGVDSGPVLKLFFLVVGAGILGTILILTWGFLTGKFCFTNDPARLPLEAEDSIGDPR